MPYNNNSDPKRDHDLDNHPYLLNGDYEGLELRCTERMDDDMGQLNPKLLSQKTNGLGFRVWG